MLAFPTCPARIGPFGAVPFHLHSVQLVGAQSADPGENAALNRWLGVPLSSTNSFGRSRDVNVAEVPSSYSTRELYGWIYCSSASHTVPLRENAWNDTGPDAQSTAVVMSMSYCDAAACKPPPMHVRQMKLNGTVAVERTQGGLYLVVEYYWEGGDTHSLFDDDIQNYLQH